jgi:hypothetical protein
MRITARGAVGIGTVSPNVKFDILDTGYPSAKIKSSYTVSGFTYSSLHFGDQTNNQGGDCGFIYNSGTPSSSFFHWTPYGSSQGSTFKVTSGGSVGINIAGTPTTPLQVGGTVTATAFSGPLTGVVTGSAGSSLTGNVTGIASGNIKQGGGTNQTTNVVYMGWSAGSKLRVQVDSTDFGSTWPIDVSGNSATATTSASCSGNAATATTASTVSDSAITAAKLDGNQSGSAPIFGVRAWAVFAGSTAGVTSQFGGNVTIARVNVGRYTATFDGATPMPNANYCVVGTANNDTAASSDSGMIIAVRSKTTTSFIMDITDPTSNTYFDPKDANIMVIG